MSAAGADWLVREDREKYEQPEKVIDALRLTSEMTVADVGAGVGYFSLRISPRVPQGKVLAVDIQPEMVQLLQKNIREAARTNIEAILSTETDPHLSPMSVDLALMVDVYHELQYPEEMMSGIRRGLKRDGRLVLVEYRGEDPNVPIKPLHKMSKEQIMKEFPPNGFKLVEQFDKLRWQHLMFFERAE